MLCMKLSLVNTSYQDRPRLLIFLVSTTLRYNRLLRIRLYPYFITHEISFHIVYEVFFAAA